MPIVKVLFHQHVEKRGGIPITAITAIAFMASQKETPVIAVILLPHVFLALWITLRAFGFPTQM